MYSRAAGANVHMSLRLARQFRYVRTDCPEHSRPGAVMDRNMHLRAMMSYAIAMVVLTIYGGEV